MTFKSGWLLFVFMGVAYSEDIVITPCTSNPCQFGGVCTPDGDSYSCDCKPPGSGKNCATLYGDPCASDPCEKKFTICNHI